MKTINKTNTVANHAQTDDAPKADAKAQTTHRYFCRRCGTVTYSESLYCVYCRKCGNGPL